MTGSGLSDLDEASLEACVQARAPLEIEMKILDLDSSDDEAAVLLARCPHCSSWYLCLRVRTTAERTHGWEHAHHGDVVFDRWTCVLLLGREFLRLRNSPDESTARRILQELAPPRACFAGTTDSAYEADETDLRPFRREDFCFYGVEPPDPESMETTLAALLGLDGRGL